MLSWNELLQIFFEKDYARLAFWRPGMCYDLPRRGMSHIITKMEGDYASLSSPRRVYRPSGRTSSDCRRRTNPLHEFLNILAPDVFAAETVAWRQVVLPLKPISHHGSLPLAACGRSQATAQRLADLYQRRLLAAARSI